MKGRAITAEEFERMISKTESVVGIKTRAKTPEKTQELEKRNSEIVESWKHFLHGLWWSGPADSGSARATLGPRRIQHVR